MDSQRLIRNYPVTRQRFGGWSIYLKGGIPLLSQLFYRRNGKVALGPTADDPPRLADFRWPRYRRTASDSCLSALSPSMCNGDDCGRSAPPLDCRSKIGSCSPTADFPLSSRVAMTDHMRCPSRRARRLDGSLWTVAPQPNAPHRSADACTLCIDSGEAHCGAYSFRSRRLKWGRSDLYSSLTRHDDYPIRALLRPVDR